MNVSLSVDLPPDAEQQLRAESPDLPAAVRENFAVNLFRRGIVSHFELGRMLDLDRFETDTLLRRHQVTEQALTHEDVDADVEGLREFLGRSRP